MMSAKRPYALVAVLLLAACSSPEDASKPSPEDAGADLSLGRDMAPGDAGSDDLDATVARDMVRPPFDFGFEPVQIDFSLSGLQPATVLWEGSEYDAQFFIFGHLGTLSFEADGRHYTYRLEADVQFLGGEIRLGLSERSCVEATSPCEQIPDALRESIVYDTLGRYDGEQVVFAPLTVRPEALELAPGFDFQPPIDPRMTPNDGFKPAQVPDARGNWVGKLTFIPSGQALTGLDPCQIIIDQVGADYELISMECGGTTFALDADPGPDSSSLAVNTTEWIVAFDFVDGPVRYTFAGLVDVGAWGGVVVESSVYENLDSPLDVPVGDVDGLFYFTDAP